MRALLLFLFLLVAACATTDDFPLPATLFAPRHYVAVRTEEPVYIDGKLDDDAWQSTPFSEHFVDIEGHLKPLPPHFPTQMKIIWDDRYLYIGAEMIDPHVWATLKKRDSVIFHDNDFEVFIDPDGDTHQYYELEINALGTEWDLRLPKPYRDDGHAVDAWDIEGLKTAIHVHGTLNDPSDIDRGWSVEMAIPWRALAEFAGRPSPPEPGDFWRVNFSRVQWRTRIENGRYVKEEGPESNWVWSPQGLINMHYPERWGYVTFAAEPRPAYPFDPGPAERAKWSLRETYYAWRRGEIEGDARFHAEERLPDGRIVSIDHEGRTRVTKESSE